MALRKYLFVIVMVLMLGTFTGCQEGTDTITSNPFLGGSMGVIAEFEEIGLVSDVSNMNEVYEDEEFSIELTLKNKGEHPIEEGEVIVELQGVNTDDFGISGTEANDEDIEEVTEFFKEGGQVTVDFGNAKYDVTGSFYDANIFAVYNYPYETDVAIPKVCYKGDVREKRVCTIDEQKQVYSSGAPILATKVVESPAATRKIRLLIDIENVGGGRASADRNFDNRYDEINFEVMTEGWGCKSKGSDSARLVDGKGQIICTLENELSENDLYEKQFDMKLNYYYEDIEQVTIRILEQI